MNRDKFLEKTALRCGYPLKAAENIFQAMVDTLGDVLSQGESVDFSPAFGKFIPQLREHKLNPNSPRTPKTPHYYICFRSGSAFEKKMRVEKPPQTEVMMEDENNHR